MPEFVRIFLESFSRSRKCSCFRGLLWILSLWSEKSVNAMENFLGKEFFVISQYPPATTLDNWHQRFWKQSLTCWIFCDCLHALIFFPKLFWVLNMHNIKTLTILSVQFTNVKVHSYCCVTNLWWKLFCRVWLCDSMDYILQARILEWEAFPFSKPSSQPRVGTQVSHVAGEFFTSWNNL